MVTHATSAAPVGFFTQLARHLLAVLREAWRVLQPVLIDFAQEVAHWWVTGRKAGERFSSTGRRFYVTDHHPSGGPEEYRFTFGLKYSTQPHPYFSAAHPEGWLTIVARDEEQARGVANSLLDGAWAFCYRGPFDGERWQRDCPRGELARIDLSVFAAAPAVGDAWAELP